jgi:hypothetical protein
MLRVKRVFMAARALRRVKPVKHWVSKLAVLQCNKLDRHNRPRMTTAVWVLDMVARVPATAHKLRV